MQTNKFSQVTDFLEDPSFLLYCEGKDASAIQKWRDWLQENPNKQEIANTARQVFWALVLQEKEIKQHQSQFEKKYNKRNKTHIALTLKVASIFLAVMSIAFFIYNPTKKELKTVKTNKGEIKQIRLPDNSELYVNSNSEVQFDTVDFESARLVHLIKGEVFCRVDNNTSKKSAFYVQTSSGLKIEDVSTAFSVKSRTDILAEEVVQVQEGLVKLHAADKTIPLRENEQIRFNPISNAIITGRSDEMSASGWINGDYAFYNVPLNELAQTLQDVYAVPILFNNAKLISLKITIFFNKSQDIGQILENIEDLYHLKISNDGNRIIFE